MLDQYYNRLDRISSKFHKIVGQGAYQFYKHVLGTKFSVHRSSTVYGPAYLHSTVFQRAEISSTEVNYIKDIVLVVNLNKPHEWAEVQRIGEITALDFTDEPLQVGDQLQCKIVSNTYIFKLTSVESQGQSDAWYTYKLVFVKCMADD